MSPKILLIHDNPELIGKVEAAAQAIGAALSVTADAQAVDREISLIEPDVIVLDLDWAPGSGLLGILRANATTPILALATQPTVESGITGFLPQPWNPIVATLALQSAIRLSRAEHQARELQARALQLEAQAQLSELASGLPEELLPSITQARTRIEELQERASSPSIEVGVVRTGAERIEQSTTRAHRALRVYSALFAPISHQLSDVPVATLLEQAADLSRERLRADNVTVQLPKVSPDLRVQCHAPRLLQALGGFVHYARLSVRELSERWIKLNAESEQSGVAISIAYSESGDPAIQHGPHRRGVRTLRKLIESAGGNVSLDNSSPHTRIVIRFG